MLILAAHERSRTLAMPLGRGPAAPGHLLPAALPVAPRSPCFIPKTRTQSAAIPSAVGLPGTGIWSSDCQQEFAHTLLF